MHIKTHSGLKPYREIELRRPKRIRRKKPKSPPQPIENEPSVVIFQTNHLPPEYIINNVSIE